MTKEPPHSASRLCSGLTLDILAGRIAEELALLAELAQGMQEALSHCRFAVQPNAETLAGLQAIDRISQGVEDLRHLMDALPEQLPPSIPVMPETLLARLQLRDLADRLASTEPTCPLARRGHGGDVCWF